MVDYPMLSGKKNLSLGVDEFRKKYSISQSEVEENEALLEKSRAKDRSLYEQRNNEALESYKENTGLVKKLFDKVKGGYVPDIEPEESIETKVWSDIVHIQDRINEGVSVFSNLRSRVDSLYEDYQKCESEELELESIIKDISNKIEKSEKAQNFARSRYDSLRRDIHDYSDMEESERDRIFAETDELCRELGVYDSDEGQKFLETYFASGKYDIFCDNLKETIDLHDKEVLAFKKQKRDFEWHYETVKHQQDLINEQLGALQKSVVPARDNLLKLMMKYQNIKSTADTAHDIIVLNEIRSETPGIISKADADIEELREKVRLSLIEADLSEEVAEYGSENSI
ncbi:MAG: hypothetical protein ACLFUO_02510 [Candidatus Woesearchaeota archaeon]